MSIGFHEISRKVWNYPWLKWTALILAVLILICFFRCCDFSRLIPSPDPPGPNSGMVDPPGYSEPWFPSQPRGRAPIDTAQIIEHPDDPLKRRALAGLLNVYLKDHSDIKAFVRKLRDDFPEDSIKATHWAEEYKRVQLSLVQERLDFLATALKNGYPSVKYAVPEWLFLSNSVEFNDVGYSDTAYFSFYNLIGLFEAWEEGLGSSDIRIAVVDDGFQLGHPELEGRYRDPWNVVDYSSNVYIHDEQSSHGTHVAGTVVANIDNGVGISGVAPNCQFIPIQIGDGSGYLSMSSIIDGIFYALNHEADIINLSLGMNPGDAIASLSESEQEEFSKSQLLDEAQMWDEIYQVAQEQNTIIVQAAGNNRVLAALDPMKRSSSSIVVGAISYRLDLSVYSNYGTAVDIYAPGDGIFSATPDGGIGPMDGTSMASPMVAGCVALALSKNRDLGCSELIQKMRETGIRSPSSDPIIKVDKLLSAI